MISVLLALLFLAALSVGLIVKWDGHQSLVSFLKYLGFFGAIVGFIVSLFYLYVDYYTGAGLCCAIVLYLLKIIGLIGKKEALDFLFLFVVIVLALDFIYERMKTKEKEKG